MVEVLERMKRGERVNLYEIYSDEEVVRLIKRLEELKKEVKSIEATLSELDKLALNLMKDDGIDTFEVGEVRVKLVRRRNRVLDKERLKDFLAEHHKFLSEFEDVKESFFIRRTLKG